MKKKKIKGEEKKSEAQQNGKKKERKVFDLPGQKREPPEEVNYCRVSLVNFLLSVCFGSCFLEFLNGFSVMGHFEIAERPPKDFL